MRTLSYYLEKPTLSSGDVRYFPDHLLSEVDLKSKPCSGSLREKLEWIRNQRTEYPECQHCGKLLTSKHWDPRFNKYREFCDKSCSAKYRQASDSYKQTNLQKYGTEHPFSSEVVQKKRIQTNLEKYGRSHPHPWNSEQFENIIYDKHGVDKVRHIQGVSEKITNSILEKTKQEFLVRLSKVPQDYECLTKMEDIKWISARSIDQVLTWKHECGKIFESPILLREGQIRPRVCPSCTAGTSKLEQTLFEFVKSICDDAENGNRTVIKPYELDIYVPSLKLGIEFDGTYWHSAKFVNADETRRKFELCVEKGIKLITVTESAFIIRPEMVEARLIHALGKTNTRVYARKCEVLELDSATKNAFFKANHLDRDARSSIAYGLFHQGKLVAAMSFGRSRFSKKHEFEIIRAASLVGTTVVGGVSKLISHFIKVNNPKSLITYANLEWGSGQSYAEAGMKFSHFTKPGYFYVSKTNEVVTRYMAQKSKLSKLLGENYNPYLTELENMKNAGYIQVFDKGNAVYEFIRTSS